MKAACQRGCAQLWRRLARCESEIGREAEARSKEPRQSFVCRRGDGAVAAVDRRLFVEPPFFVDFNQVRSGLHTLASNDRAGLRPHHRTHDGHSGLDDAGFFPGDFLDGMAEEIFVVEIDRRDDGDFRRDDIRGIEPAAQAHFIDREIDALLGEDEKRHGGDAFEERRMRAASAPEAISDSMAECTRVQAAAKSLVGNVFAIDADALVDALKVRRSVKPGAQARRRAESIRASPPWSLCHWCRRCGRTERRDADRRGRREGS